MRLPIVPGADPRVMYGDLVQRGVKGVVLEAFGGFRQAVVACGTALVFVAVVVIRC